MADGLRISLSMLCWDSKKLGFEKIPERMSKIGADEMDLAAFEGWQGISPKRLSEDAAYFADALEKMKSCGVRISAINSDMFYYISDPDPEKYAACTAEFTALCRFGENLGVHSLTVYPGVVSEGESRESYEERFIPRARAWGEIAKKHGIFLSFEGHEGSGLETPEQMISAAKKMWPLAGLTIDGSQFHMQGYTLDDVRKCLPYIRHAHIRYAAVGKMVCKKEENTLDLFGYLRVLKEGGYLDSVAIEFFDGFLPEEEIRELYKALNEMIKEI